MSIDTAGLIASRGDGIYAGNEERNANAAERGDEVANDEHGIGFAVQQLLLDAVHQHGEIDLRAEELHEGHDELREEQEALVRQRVGAERNPAALQVLDDAEEPAIDAEGGDEGEIGQ